MCGRRATVTTLDPFVADLMWRNHADVQSGVTSVIHPSLAAPGVALNAASP